MDHHGRPSFRVDGRIFATLWTAGQMNVMLDVHGIMDAVDAHPNVCREMWWGQRLAPVQVDLTSIKPWGWLGNISSMATWLLAELMPTWT